MNIDWDEVKQIADHMRMIQDLRERNPFAKMILKEIN